MITLIVCGVTTFALITTPASSRLGDAAQENGPGRASGPVQMVRFNLYDAGIRPREAYSEKGRVMVVLDDHTGGAEELVIERETNGGREAVGRVRRAEDKRRGKSEFHLGPGRYHVFASNRPTNQALLIVEP
jgi:hypothetical protein